MAGLYSNSKKLHYKILIWKLSVCKDCDYGSEWGEEIILLFRLIL